MADIYDRSKWPPPDLNPLVNLIRQNEEYYSNYQVNVALDPARADQRSRAPLSSWPNLQRMLDTDDTIVAVAGTFYQSPAPLRANQGAQRWWSRRAVIEIALQARTINAVAFRHWLTSMVAKEIVHE